jgi:X-X-X-Leu-X-X-Gly heptad repeat protein
MVKLARASIRRPKLALSIWAAVAIALTLIGLGVSSALSPSITVVPGTQSSQAQQLASAQFGPSQLVPILLEGPKSQLDVQGPALVRALSQRVHTRVMSAWDGGAVTSELRPSATAAMIVASIDRSEKDVVRYDEPQVERLVSQKVSAPVKAFVTGQPSIDRAEKSASIDNLRRTELIAVGVLFVLLLLGLRAPVAAVVVTAVGAFSVLAGFGLVAILGHVSQVDPIAVTLGTMTGLALAVGFSLMVLDRFHGEEDLTSGHARDAVTAATKDLETTGRSVLVAGGALVLALAIVAAIGPTALMVSLGTGMLVCAAFATGGAVVVMPAALVVLGRRIDSWSFPAPAFMTRGWRRLVGGGSWVTRHAAATGFVATAVLAVLAVPALALKSGAPSVSQLPSSSTARIAFQEVSRVMGPGWATPYDLIVVSKNLPITTPSVLAGLSTLQTQIAKNSTVYSVTGPGQINSTSAQLKTFGPSLAHSVTLSDQSKKGLLTLIGGLGQAGAGAAQLQSGLKAASSGASQLRTGGGTAHTGAGQLHAGLATAKAGSATLSAGLNTALSAAIQLRDGANKALAGADQLAAGLGKGAPQVATGVGAANVLANETAATDSQIKTLQGQAKAVQTQLGSALSSLQSMSPAARTEPQYAATLSALQSASGQVSSINSGLTSAANSADLAAPFAAGVASQIKLLAPQLTAAANGAAQLAAGIKQLHAGNAQLAAGMAKLAGGGSQLNTGLGALTNGAGQLQSGLALLSGGAGSLATGLAGGVGPAGQLTAGLGVMQAAVAKSRGQISSTAALKQLFQQSPGMFSSGYFVLAAVAGAPAVQRTDATFTINLLRGGNADQILVVSKYPSNDARTAALGSTLAKLSQSYARTHDAEVAIGGPAGNLGDLTSVTKSRVWLDILVLALAMVTVLGIALRAVVLPVVATAFSLLVAGASFGVLQLLLGGSNPPLGGPGYLDPMTIIGAFTVIFGVTVTFSTILLMRTREIYVEAPGRRAIAIALARTAAAVTGAGLVMIAALVPFAISQLINLRAFGIGVAVAVLLDILLVRPVLLPAAEVVLGRFGWWPGAASRGEQLAGARQVRRVPRPHLSRHRPAHQ